MKAFTGVLCALLCIAQINAAPNTFIGNGVEATENKYSVIILALAKPEDHRALFGSGTIISARHILTAAHICVNAKQFRIGYGETVARETIRITATSALVHSRFNTATLENDIAIITLGSRQAIGLNIATPVYIAKTPVTVGDKGTVTSFGFDSSTANSISEKLMVASQEVIDNIHCVNEYDRPVSRNQFCAQDPTAPKKEDDGNQSGGGASGGASGGGGASDGAGGASGDDGGIPNPPDPDASAEATAQGNDGFQFPWSRKVRIAFNDNKVSAVCRGDTGSALVKKVGDNFVAFGIVSRVPKGCDGEKPALYTQIAQFTEWIDDATVSAVNFAE